MIAGLTNTYSSYVTTYEEYQAQRYEGASTIFGPHTLDAYIQVKFLCVTKDTKLSLDLCQGQLLLIDNTFHYMPPHHIAAIASRAAIVDLNTMSTNWLLV